MEYNKLTNFEILETFIATLTGTDYQDYIPELTRENIAEVGNAILDYQPTKEKFYNHFLVKITDQLFQQFYGDNRFSFLKNGSVHGIIEDTFIERVKGESYDVNSTKSPFETAKGTEKTIYHDIQEPLVYEMSINDYAIRRSFLTDNGLSDFIASKISVLSESAIDDEYIMLKNMFVDIYTATGEKALLDTQKVPLTGTTNTELASSLLYELKKYSKYLTYNKDTYNTLKVRTKTPLERQCIVLTSDMALDIDMGVLANVFNIDKLALSVNKIVEVDNFNDNAKIVSVLFDKQGVIDRVLESSMETIRNPRTKTTNYFYHVGFQISWRLFNNIIYFTLPDITTLSTEDTEETGK